ncbi:MAG: GNAT family N-acetyltransferase [Candidatus Pacearchaeota archaeon]|jgi:RimJ/RimL family protein N-acetyltransferase
MILKTQRLILRKPKISDWKDIVEGLKDVSVAEGLEEIPHPYKKKDALIWIKKTIERWKKKKKEVYTFMIELKSEKKIIGGIGLHKVDKFVGTAGTGSWINKKYWRKGYVTEAKIAVNEFAFNKLKLRKLYSYVYTDNKASNRTQKSMEYKFEGCSKKGSRTRATGKIKDVNIYGLFKEDWKRNLPKLKKKLNEKIRKLEKNDNERF